MCSDMKRYCRTGTTLKNVTVLFMWKDSGKDKAHKSKAYDFQGIRYEIKS